MKVIQRTAPSPVATVFIGKTETGALVEFVESVEPPYPVEKKWVTIVSTLYGCPVQCSMCDAGLRYRGKLTLNDILAQLDYLINNRFPGGVVRSEKWKVQFARMGDPAFNGHVIAAMRILPERYRAQGLFPSISTIAPCGCDRFFSELVEVKRECYPERFQFQFSIHSSDERVRRQLIPVDTWDFRRMAAYGEAIHAGVGRFPSLNFALMKDVPVDPAELRRHFSPELFVLKVTPLNPTSQALQNGLVSLYDDPEGWRRTVGSLRDAGYTVIESVGELVENAIGSNCGQYIQAVTAGNTPPGSYSRRLEAVD